MGAWGPGPFNSDDGLELAAIVEHSEFSAVRKRLKFDRDDDADCAHAYAAAAIVAASQGHRVAEFPLELDKPLAKFRKACQRAHVDQAINALETIKKDSALKQLWKESPSGTRPLTTEINKLLKLLNSKPRALPPPPPRPKRRKITAGDWFGIAVGREEYAFVRILYVAKKGEFGEPVLIAVYHGISPKPVLPDPPPHKVLARKAVLPDYFTVIENDYEVIPLQRAPLTRDETHLTEYRVGHRKVCRNAKKICDVSKKDEVLPDITSISFTPTWTLYEALKLCSPRKDFSLQMHTRGMLIALANNDWDSVHGDAECILEESDCDPQRRALALYWRGEALKHLGHPRRGEKDQNEAKHLLPDVAHVKTPF